MKIFFLLFLFFSYTASSQIIEMNKKEQLRSAKVKTAKCYLIKKSGTAALSQILNTTSPAT